MTNQNELFSQGDMIVYPAHGVGQIIGVESHSIAGQDIKLYVITFDQDRMTLKVPVQNAQKVGLRKVSTQNRIKDALKILKGKAKANKTMWSRRSAEYTGKINSGDPVQVAEVVRDLYKDETQEQSYSERSIYKQALERLARELAASEKIDEGAASEKLIEILSDKAA